MHELGIVQEVVSLVVERTKDASRVTRLVLEIGKLSSVLPDAVRFCFDVATEGTILERAELTIVEVDGRGRCRPCGNEVVLERFFGRCACGSSDLEWTAGTDVRIVELEVA